MYSSERSRQIEELNSTDSSLKTAQLPGLWELFDRDGESPAPVVNEPAEDAEDRVAIYIHSSGTTGKSRSDSFIQDQYALTQVASYRNAQASPNDKWLSDDNGRRWFYSSPRREMQ